MNLEPLLAWGRKVVGILEAPSAEVLGWVSVERLHEKLGWLLDLRDGLDEWSQWQAVVGFVICRGLDRGAARDLIAALPGSLRASSRSLAAEMVRFVRSESSQARLEERLPGSTAVLESCFGKFKALEKEHARGGFTGLVLTLRAFLAAATKETIVDAFAASHAQDVWDWCRENLGTTLFGKRKLVFQEGVQIRDENPRSNSSPQTQALVERPQEKGCGSGRWLEGIWRLLMEVSFADCLTAGSVPACAG